MCQVILNAPVYAKQKNQLYMPKGKSLNCSFYKSRDPFIYTCGIPHNLFLNCFLTQLFNTILN